jgi:hypothetical protein
MVVTTKLFGPILRNLLNSDKLHGDETTTSYVIGDLHQERDISTTGELSLGNLLRLKTTKFNLLSTAQSTLTTCLSKTRWNVLVMEPGMDPSVDNRAWASSEGMNKKKRGKMMNLIPSMPTLR